MSVFGYFYHVFFDAQLKQYFDIERIRSVDV